MSTFFFNRKETKLNLRVPTLLGFRIGFRISEGKQTNLTNRKQSIESCYLPRRPSWPIYPGSVEHRASQIVEPLPKFFNRGANYC